MKFTYDDGHYDIQAIIILFLGFLLIVLSKTYAPSALLSLTGMIVGILATCASLVFKGYASFQRRFAFFITKNTLKIDYRGYTVEFLWPDILDITENKNGFAVQVNRNKTKFFISSSLKDCQTFKAMLLEKANQHKIPWILIDG